MHSLIKIASCIAFLHLPATDVKALGANQPSVVVADIALAFHFPTNELVITDATRDSKLISNNSILHAYKITSKNPFAFYPVLISVAKEGTFVNEGSKLLLRQIDSLPEGPVSSGGRGPLGSLPLSTGINGGIYFGEIAVPPPDEPFELSVSRMAMYSCANIPSKRVDVRVAVLATFAEDKLVKISGGELYYRMFGTQDQTTGAVEAISVDKSLRAAFTSIDRAVYETLPAKNENIADAPTAAPQDAKTTLGMIPSDAGPLRQTDPAAEHIEPAKSSVRVWGWVLIVIVLFLTTALVWKQRKKPRNSK